VVTIFQWVLLTIFVAPQTLAVLIYRHLRN